MARCLLGRVTVAASHPSFAPRPRVLVAEDDPALRELLVCGLEARGYEVIGLADGGRLLVEIAASIRVGGRRAPDLIVSDIRMPVMSGLQMASTVREIDPDIPLVLLTAFADGQLEQRVRALDAHLLVKPFTLAALAELLERCLNPASADRRGR